MAQKMFLFVLSHLFMIYIYIYGEIVDFGESEKMIKNKWKSE